MSVRQLWPRQPQERFLLVVLNFPMSCLRICSPRHSEQFLLLCSRLAPALRLVQVPITND